MVVGNKLVLNGAYALSRPRYQLLDEHLTYPAVFTPDFLYFQAPIAPRSRLLTPDIPTHGLAPPRGVTGLDLTDLRLGDGRFRRAFDTTIFDVRGFSLSGPVAPDAYGTPTGTQVMGFLQIGLDSHDMRLGVSVSTPNLGGASVGAFMRDMW